MRQQRFSNRKSIGTSFKKTHRSLEENPVFITSRGFTTMAAKKSTKRKAPAKRKVAKPKAPAKKSLSAIKSRYSKTQIVTELAESNELTRKQVSSVIEDLADLIERHVKKGACGEFVLPGLLKVNTVKKPARKARKGINPFTGEETMFKAKPASTVVKVRPLKKLKEMAG
ncbi:MAG: HU family DNA-binding protein [Pseudomonadales bacterium]